MAPGGELREGRRTLCRGQAGRQRGWTKQSGQRSRFLDENSCGGDL